MLCMQCYLKNYMHINNEIIKLIIIIIIITLNYNVTI